MFTLGVLKINYLKKKKSGGKTLSDNKDLLLEDTHRSFLQARPVSLRTCPLLHSCWLNQYLGLSHNIARS